jgi:hypothetical protein
MSVGCTRIGVELVLSEIENFDEPNKYKLFNTVLG